MAQFIFTMQGVGKVVPPKREILKNIWLSFYPGAKIGVLGSNGSGKSSLLKIMSGMDKEFNGEARPQPGIKIGYLPQEPQLNASKTVRGNVEEGVGEIMQLLNRFNEISDKFAEPMSDAEMNKLLEEQGDLQNAIDAAGAWELERKLEIAADALRLPAWDADVTKLSGGERRRVALCRLLLSNPDMLLLDEPTNHLDAESVAWLEQFLHDYPGTVVAVTHDRYFLDNAASWILELDRGQGIPYEGNYSSWLEQKEKTPGTGRTPGSFPSKNPLKQNWNGYGLIQKAAVRKAKRVWNGLKNSIPKNFKKRNETQELYIPPGPRLGEVVIEAKDLSKQFNDKLIF